MPNGNSVDKKPLDQIFLSVSRGQETAENLVYEKPEETYICPYPRFRPWWKIKVRSYNLIFYGETNIRFSIDSQQMLGL